MPVRSVRIERWTRDRVVSVVAGVGLIGVGIGGTVWKGGGGWSLALAAIGAAALVDAIAGYRFSFSVARLPRYLRWTFHCRRGRRCADLQVMADELHARVTGERVTVRLRWRCAGCGTEYERDELAPAIVPLTQPAPRDFRW